MNFIRRCKKYKDAGFVHESFRNKMNRVIWDFWPYETNPQNESFENCITKRIHKTNLLKTRGFTNPNPKDSDRFVYPIVLRICEDLLDLLDLSNLLKIASQNKSAKRIFWKWLDSWSTIRNKSFQVRICDPRYETNPDLWSTSRYESMDSQNESTFFQISYTIPATLKNNYFRHSLASIYNYINKNLQKNKDCCSKDI